MVKIKLYSASMLIRDLEMLDFFFLMKEGTKNSSLTYSCIYSDTVEVGSYSDRIQDGGLMATWR